MPKVGLEPTHLAILDFESSASTSFTTRAVCTALHREAILHHPISFCYIFYLVFQCLLQLCFSWCPRPDSNRHSLREFDFKSNASTIPPLGQFVLRYIVKQSYTIEFRFTTFFTLFFSVSLTVIHSLVPEVGLEPTHPYEYKILSLARLPFHHSGNSYCVTSCCTFYINQFCFTTIFTLFSSVSLTYVVFRFQLHLHRITLRLWEPSIFFPPQTFLSPFSHIELLH